MGQVSRPLILRAQTRAQPTRGVGQNSGKRVSRWTHPSRPSEQPQENGTHQNPPTVLPTGERNPLNRGNPRGDPNISQTAETEVPGGNPSCAPLVGWARGFPNPHRAIPKGVPCRWCRGQQRVLAPHSCPKESPNVPGVSPARGGP